MFKRPSKRDVRMLDASNAAGHQNAFPTAAAKLIPFAKQSAFQVVTDCAAAAAQVISPSPAKKIRWDWSLDEKME